MSAKLNFGLSFAAGLLGGALSQHLFPGLVHAQNQATAQKEVRAKSFVLVNDKDQTIGVFGPDKSGTSSLTLLDPQGHVLWSVNGKAAPRLLTGLPK